MLDGQPAAGRSVTGEHGGDLLFRRLDCRRLWTVSHPCAKAPPNQDERGRTVMRRLNRVEFEYTLRDLLELPWLEVKDLLPEDGRDGGYTRSAAALDVSPIFLASWQSISDRIYGQNWRDIGEA